MMTENQMKNDPKPPAATCTFTEVKEDETQLVHKTAKDTAAEFFNKNKITRVPVIALQSDLHRVENQNWACFSIIKPDEYGKLTHREKTYNGYLIKLRGVFATKEQAVKHIEKVMSVDRHFDIHLVPMFSWASVEDDEVEDREYASDIIKEIVTGYFKKENDKFASFRDRIASTEASERSEESTRFFEECNADKLEKLADEFDSLTGCAESTGSVDNESAVVATVPVGQPLSLDDIAKGLNINPGGSWCDHGELDETCVQSIISEILLD